jgi:hypothetical protein
MDRDQAYREIQEMVDSGILVPPKKPGRGARYHLSPGVLQAKLWIESRVPTLRRHFARHEILKNADYRELFGTARYRAVEELQRLVDDGYLVRRGEKKGTHYLPGPRL